MTENRYRSLNISRFLWIDSSEWLRQQLSFSVLATNAIVIENWLWVVTSFTFQQPKLLKTFTWLNFYTPPSSHKTCLIKHRKAVIHIGAILKVTFTWCNGASHAEYQANIINCRRRRESADELTRKSTWFSWNLQNNSSNFPFQLSSFMFLSHRLCENAWYDGPEDLYGHVLWHLSSYTSGGS